MRPGQNSGNTASINPQGAFPYQWFYNLVLLSASDSLLTYDPYQRECCKP